MYCYAFVICYFTFYLSLNEGEDYKTRFICLFVFYMSTFQLITVNYEK